MTDAEFFEFTNELKNHRVERNKSGDIFISPPVGLETGLFENDASFFVQQWATTHGGKAINSNIGFILANNAVRSPDCGWISEEKFNSIPHEERKRFPRMCPDMVLEIRSPSDQLKPLHAKMTEYMENGALLGFLIDPTEQKAFIYRVHKPIETIDDFAGHLSGYEVMPGFELPLSIFEPKG